MQEINPEIYQSYQATLTEVLGSEKADQYALPNLVTDENFWDRWMKQLNDWLDPKIRTPDPGHFNWGAAFEILQYILLIGILIALGFVIYRWGKRRLAERQLLGQLGKAAPKALQDPDQYLSREIADALKQNDLRLAARLRWKLFLKRRRDDPFLTPGEFLGREGKRAGGIDARFFDQFMFGKQVWKLTDYENLQRELEGLEASHAA